MLRFGAIFKLLVAVTAFELVVLRDTLAGANPKHCCWVEISRAMDSRDLIIFSVAKVGVRSVRVECSFSDQTVETLG